MIIDIDGIDDTLNDGWWNHVRFQDFGYLNSIFRDTIHAFEVDEGDLLIHHQMVEEDGKKFPKTTYFIIKGSTPRNVKVAEVRSHLAEQFVRLFKKTRIYPFGCVFVKTFKKDGSVQVNYDPSDYFKLVFKITSTSTLIVPDAPVIAINPHPLAPRGQRRVERKVKQDTSDDEDEKQVDTKQDIEPDRVHKIPAASEVIEASKGNEKGSVSIFDALVVAMKRYESTFTRFSTSQQEEVSEKTIHYMLQLDDGLVASDTKKRTPRTPFSGVLVRLSEPAAAGVNVGDRITFNGKLDNDSFWSHMIKNVKKVSTSPGTGDQP